MMGIISLWPSSSLLRRLRLFSFLTGAAFCFQMKNLSQLILYEHDQYQRQQHRLEVAFPAVNHTTQQQHLVTSVARANVCHHHHCHQHQQKHFRACLIVKNDNHLLAQWIAYHYNVLPLRQLIVGVDENFSEDPMDVLRRWNDTTPLLSYQVWYPDDYQAHTVQYSTASSNPQEKFILRQHRFLTRCLQYFHNQHQQQQHQKQTNYSTNNNHGDGTSNDGRTITQDTNITHTSNNSSSAWVALVDTDEFIKLNPLDDFLVPQFVNETSYRWNKDMIKDALLFMAPNETLWDRIVARKRLRQKLGLEANDMTPSSSSLNTTTTIFHKPANIIPTVLEVLDEYSLKHGTLPCHSISRRRYSAVRGRFAILAKKMCRPRLDDAIITSSMNISSLRIIQFLYHVPPLSFEYNEWAKVLVDVSRIPYEKLARVEHHLSPHNPLDECPHPYVPDVISFIHANHYTNDWEVHLRRRRQRVHDTTNISIHNKEQQMWSQYAHTRRHARCDQIHGWLNAFVREFGMERTKHLLFMDDIKQQQRG